MRYSSPAQVPATEWGKSMEEKAKNEYAKLIQCQHCNFNRKNTGLHICSDLSRLIPSPDGIISCDCHGKDTLEVKCPYKYHNGLLP